MKLYRLKLKDQDNGLSTLDNMAIIGLLGIWIMGILYFII